MAIDMMPMAALVHWTSIRGMLNKVENRTFEDQPVQLDGNAYVRCTFNRCILMYGATGRVEFDGCRIRACKWAFDGAAAKALDFMKVIYNWDPAGRAMIENTLRGLGEMAAGKSGSN